MSTTVFPFTRFRPYREWYAHGTTIVEGNEGMDIRRAELGAYGRFRVRLDLRLPVGSYTIKDWHDFVQDRQGAYDTFLFKATQERNKTVTQETLTGTVNGSNTVFYTTRKHIDAASLVVYRDGVSTANYTLSLNNSTPKITYDTAPTVSAKATYDYYHAMRFLSDDMEPEDLHITSGQATSNFRLTGIEMIEEYPGEHRDV